ncbi:MULTISPECIES: plastocyanin/azurin family copper-binding protein [Aphanothece]|uniref:plastocyanin/azurin family copper-binding protein n=1 Tax=Aphanothece TaxID=1121 RepID=UPI00398E53AC
MCPLLLLLWLVGLSAPAQAATHRLQLGSDEGLLALQPSQLTIAAGDVVHVEVAGLGPHNLIVEDHPEWSHPRLAFSPGESWEQRFDTPGRFRLWCEPHRFAGMEGSLTVTPAAGS